MRKKSIFGLYGHIKQPWNFLLGVIPIAFLFIGFQVLSWNYLADNPDGKLFRGWENVFAALHRMATVKDVMSGEYLLWSDMFVTLKRLLVGLGLAVFSAALLGVHMAFFPWIRAIFLPFIRLVSNLPVIIVISIVLLLAGTGEFFKVAMVFLGTVFLLSRDIFRSADAVSRQRVTKTLTLGASPLGVIYRVMLPRLAPDIIAAIRLALPGAWIYALVSEMTISTDGLGYRVAVMRRHMEMDVIIGYVLVVSLLAILIDFVLKTISEKRYPWHNPEGK